MFGGKLKQEHQSALQRLVENERDIAALRAELARLESEQAALREEATDATTACQVADKISGNMQGFGESFIAWQQSQVSAVTALRE